jgi:hypothetical protein
MKKIFILLFALSIVSVFSLQVQAELFNRGTDTLGNRLIYDSDFNITWYDYTRSYDTWQNQMDWASELDVDFSGTHYTDWRLPSTVDGVYSYGYDGSTTAGYNITSSEMGHLYYAELGNIGWYNTSGNLTGCSNILPYCLTGTGLFENLQPTEMHIYWSGTERSSSPNDAWHFSFGFGNQNDAPKNYSGGLYAIAVLPGDVAVVPEPISSILFLAGGATLIGKRYLRKKKEEV